jgi:hypothetical protein
MALATIIAASLRALSRQAEHHEQPIRGRPPFDRTG